MIKYITPFILLAAISCKSSQELVGVYHGSKHAGNLLTRPFKKLLGQTTFIWGDHIVLNPDSTFSHYSYTSCLSDSTGGRWFVEENTLYLAGDGGVERYSIKENYLKEMSFQARDYKLKKIK